MAKGKTKAAAVKAAAQLVAFRMDPDLVKRLDAHAARMCEATPGVAFTRSDAVRVLLLGALETSEARTEP